MVMLPSSGHTLEGRFFCRLEMTEGFQVLRFLSDVHFYLGNQFLEFLHKFPHMFVSVFSHYSFLLSS